MQVDTHSINRKQLALRLNDIARAHLDFCVPQVGISYELIARELEQADAQANEDFIRFTIAQWSRPIVHFVPNAGGTEAVCGWKVNTPNPILDGMHKFLSPHYNCYQHEACPACWRLTH
jgi:hypothetical protein